MNDLTGRHALVTGGGSGLGAGIALALAEAGAGVTITGRRQAPLEQAAAAHEGIDWLVADVTDAQAVTQLFEQLAARHGRADIVIANAGAAATQPFARTSPADWQAMLDVNLTGVFLTLNAALPALRDAGWGRLIAIASTAGLKGYPYVSAYCAAKHGVVGLTRALGMELARTGVTVNALCPGYVDTPLVDAAVDHIVAKTGQNAGQVRRTLAESNPMQRFITVAEVAQAALWLCGPHSAAVTGQAIAISGGDP